jgi:uncharacterized protein (DUF1697 family)
MRYVALLRGINVGGKNLIQMKVLAAAFEAAGFRDVVTYIQSGNVLFTTSETGRAKLTRKVEALLATALSGRGSVVLKTLAQMRQIVDGAPRGFGAQPNEYRYDVIFFLDPLTSVAAMKSVSLKEGVDEAHAGKGVIYFSRLISKATQSRLSRIVALPIYGSLTIRNWKTTTALLRLMAPEPSSAKALPRARAR